MQPDIKTLSLTELQAYAYQNIVQIDALKNGLKQLQEEIDSRPVVTQTPTVNEEK